MSERETDRATEHASHGEQIPEAAPSYQAGFIESWLRRCGVRPGRTFLLIWLMLLLIWIALGFVGFEDTRYADVPPPVEAVPYAKFLPGGEWDYNGTLALDPDSLPAYDESIQTAPTAYRIVIAPDGTDSNRLSAMMTTRQGRFGWPIEFLRWMSWRYLDVTDIDGNYTPLFNSIHGGSYISETHAGISWVTNGGSTTGAVDVEWAAAVAHVFGLQVMAAIVVLTPWAWFALRHRRRQDQGRCLNCGHHLGPQGKGSRCPECGTTSSTTTEHPRQVGWRHMIATPGRRLVSLMLVLLMVWLFASIVTISHRPYDNLQSRLEEEARQFEDDLSHGGPNTRGAGLMTADTSFGWPLRVVFIWESQSFQWTQQNGTIVPTPRRYPPGHGFLDDYLQLEFAMGDPSKRRCVNLYWAQFILTLLLIQVVAIATVGLVAGVSRRKRVSPRRLRRV